MNRQPIPHQEGHQAMIRLTAQQLQTLEGSTYARDCGRDHASCVVCGDFIHAGQLVYPGALGSAHTRCMLPGLAVHQLHALVSDGRD